jgi:hypothetical protein
MTINYICSEQQKVWQIQLICRRSKKAIKTNLQRALSLLTNQGAVIGMKFDQAHIWGKALIKTSVAFALGVL